MLITARSERLGRGRGHGKFKDVVMGISHFLLRFWGFFVEKLIRFQAVKHTISIWAENCPFALLLVKNSLKLMVYPLNLKL